MASVISSVSCYQTDPSLLKDLESRWDHLASNIFEYNDTLPLDLRPSVAAKIKEQYLGGKPVSQETYPELIQALGDRLFTVAVGKLAEIHAKQSGQPTYLYRYSFNGGNSLSHMMANSNTNYGVSHADDVFEIFKYMWDSESPESVQMREALLDMVYSYASTGQPRLPNAPEWLPLKPGSPELNYMEIAGPKKLEMKSCSDFGHRSFWDSLGFIENQNYQINIKDEL